jgi:hypothetical protein
MVREDEPMMIIVSWSVDLLKRAEVLEVKETRQFLSPR